MTKRHTERESEKERGECSGGGRGCVSETERGGPPAPAVEPPVKAVSPPPPVREE